VTSAPRYTIWWTNSGQNWDTSCLKTRDTMWKTASHLLLKGLSYALLDVFGATITDIHLRASTVPIHRRKA